jgi:hypothetical protein
MKYIVTLLFILGLFGCTPRYEVIQKLEVNMYHLINIKTNEVEIILTSDSLNKGDIVKKNHIKIIAEIQK